MRSIAPGIHGPTRHPGRNGFRACAFRANNFRYLSRGVSRNDDETLTPFGIHRLICPSCQSVAATFACGVGQITGTSSRIPCPPRGAYRDRHERWAQDAVDAMRARDECARCGRRSRGVLISRRWYQLVTMAMSALRPRHAGIARGWWQESPITRETTKETVKTSRAENAGCLRCTCGDLRACFLSLHARLRVPRCTRHSLRPLFS